MPNKLLQNFVQIRKSLEDITREGEEFHGQLELTLELFAILKSFEHTNVIPFVTEDGKSCALEQLTFTNRKKIKIQLSPFSLKSLGYLYFESISDLITSFPYNLPNDPFYIFEENYFSFQDEKPSLLLGYENVVLLIDVLRAISDHEQNSGKKCILYLLMRTKIEIPITYTIEHVNRIKDIEYLSSLIIKDRDKEKSREIFKSTVASSLLNVPKQNRFIYLLQNFHDIHENFLNNFNLWLSEFSFHQVENEFEEKKVKFLSLINSVITDIQNKIIALPIAFLLAAGQMSAGSDAKNFALFSGISLFSLLCHFMVMAQFYSLSGILKDINTNEDDLKKKSSTIYSKISEKFQSLRVHHNNQKRILRMLIFIVWLIFILATALYFHFSFGLNWTHVYDYLTSLNGSIPP